MTPMSFVGGFLTERRRYIDEGGTIATDEGYECSVVCEAGCYCCADAAGSAGYEDAFAGEGAGFSDVGLRDGFGSEGAGEHCWRL